MILSKIQHRYWPLVTETEVLDVVNTRPDTLSDYHPLPFPRHLSSTTRRMLGIDRRDGVEYLISVDADRGFLYMEGTIDDAGRYTPREEMLCGDAGQVEEIAACGEFLILRRADGSLYFLRWEEKTSSYISLGEMPAEIPFTVTMEEQMPITFSIPACTWSKTVEDGRAGIPDDIRQQISRHVKQAWADAVDSCRNMDMFLQPVTVRLLMRLFDGSVFSISEPVRIPLAAWKGGDRFLLPVTADSSGNLSGTATTSFSLVPYRISVEIPSLYSALWNEVFSAVEIYMEKEQDVVGADVCTVSYITQSRSVSVFLPLHPEREMEQKLGRGPWYPAWQGALPAPPSVELGPAVGSLSLELETQKAYTPQADNLLSHGAFFHLGRKGTLMTSQSGNPLAVRSQTRFGSDIHAMAALPAGGGAYTRQYLYLFTESAIFALTCDAAGMHTNCRPVSPYVVSGQQRVIATDTYVYALTDCGCLLRISDAKATVMYRGLPSFSALQWDSATDELWLMQHISDNEPYSSSLVLQLSAPCKAYRREIKAAAIVPQSGRVMYTDGKKLMMAVPYTSYTDTMEDYAPASVSIRLPSPEQHSSYHPNLLVLRGALVTPARMKIALQAENEILMRTATTEVEFDEDMCVSIASTSAEWLEKGRRRYTLPFVASPAASMATDDTIYVVTLSGVWGCLETPQLTGTALKENVRIASSCSPPRKRYVRKE